jgi:hypothetical protein
MGYLKTNVIFSFPKEKKRNSKRFAKYLVQCGGNKAKMETSKIISSQG